MCSKPGMLHILEGEVLIIRKGACVQERPQNLAVAAPLCKWLLMCRISSLVLTCS